MLVDATFYLEPGWTAEMGGGESQNSSPVITFLAISFQSSYVALIWVRQKLYNIQPYLVGIATLHIRVDWELQKKLWGCSEQRIAELAARRCDGGRIPSP